MINSILKKLGKYLGKYFLAAFSGDIRKLKLITEYLEFKSPKSLLKAFKSDPSKVVEALDKIGREGRKDLALRTGFSDEINTIAKAEQHDAGDKESKHLSSSWQY